jgi:hypothetical protein
MVPPRAAITPETIVAGAATSVVTPHVATTADETGAMAAAIIGTIDTLTAASIGSIAEVD